MFTKGYSIAMLRMMQLIVLTSLLAGCFATLSPLEKPGASYKQNKDYASLEKVHKDLYKGMQRKRVECLLGKPDYSPIDGQYYYSSSHSKYSEAQKREIPVGLVVDYRDSNGAVTETLQEYRLGPIAE